MRSFLKNICLLIVFIININVLYCYSNTIFIKKFEKNTNTYFSSISIEINEECIYIDSMSFYCNYNKFSYKKLNFREKAIIDSIAQYFIYSEIKDVYISNKYSATFYYEIFFLNENFKKSVTIFSDTIPEEFRKLFSICDSLVKTGEFKVIKSNIKELNDIYFTSIIEKNDTNQIHFYQSFLLKRTLFLNKIKLKKVKKINNTLYTILNNYPLDYNGLKINKIIFDGKKYYLIYRKTKYLIENNLPNIFTNSY